MARLKERQIDGVIHGLGVGAAAIGAAVLLESVLGRDDARAIVAGSVYGLGLVTVFALSAAYHLIADGRAREILRRCDHAAIFVMIAGSYTPFALITLGGTMGTGLLALVWLVALFGVGLKLLWPRCHEGACVALYLALGWIGLPLIGSLIAALPVSALVLLGVGGLLYTAGVAFHLWERLPLQNAIWHGCVLAAATCHYVAVLNVLTLT